MTPSKGFLSHFATSPAVLSLGKEAQRLGRDAPQKGR